VVTDDGNENRLFVNELIREIRSQALTAEEAFNRTRMAVNRGTQGQQVPWLSSSLISDFSFALQKTASTAPVVADPIRPPATSTNSPRPVIPQLDAVTEPKPTAPGPQALLPEPASPATSPPPPPARMSSEDNAAIQDLNRRLRADANDATALYRRGQLYAKNDDFSRAISDFDAAIRLRPRDAEALNNRCWVRAIIGDLYAALQDCDASLQIKPDLVDSLDSRGFVKLKLNQSQSAIADYDASLRLSARKASSLYGRGIAKLRVGDSSGNDDISAAKAIDRDVADDFNRYGVR
jgi:tetratricopeptide (TPR) repeat protein